MPPKKKVTPRKEPTQSRSKETVETILTAATHILNTLGFDSATTNRIAEKAGISIGSLYQYFPNKESMAAALVDRYVERHATRFEKKLLELRGKPMADLARELASETVNMYLGNRKFLKILVTVAPAIDRIPSVLQVRKRIVAGLADEISARQDEIPVADPGLTAFVIVNGCMGVIQTILYDESFVIAPGPLSEELTRMALGYLRLAQNRA